MSDVGVRKLLLHPESEVRISRKAMRLESGFNLQDALRVLLHTPPRQRTSDDVEFIDHNLLRRCKGELLPELATTYRLGVAKALQYRTLRSGEVLFEEGDKSSHIFIVLSGKVEQYRSVTLKNSEQSM